MYFQNHHHAITAGKSENSAKPSLCDLSLSLKRESSFLLFRLIEDAILLFKTIMPLCMIQKVGYWVKGDFSSLFRSILTATVSSCFWKTRQDETYSL